MTPARPAGSAGRLLQPAAATYWSSWRLKLPSTLLELDLLDMLGQLERDLLLGQLELDPPEHLLKKLASSSVDAARLRLDLPDQLEQLKPDLLEEQLASNVVDAERLRLDRPKQLKQLELRLLEQPTSSDVDAERLRLDVLEPQLEQLMLDLLLELPTSHALDAERLRLDVLELLERLKLELLEQLSSNVVGAEERLRLDQMKQLITALEDGALPWHPQTAQLLHPPAAGLEANIGGRRCWGLAAAGGGSSANRRRKPARVGRPPRRRDVATAGRAAAAAPGGGRRVVEAPPPRLRSRSRQRGPSAGAALLESVEDANDLEPTTARWENARHEARMNLSQSLERELGVEVAWGRGGRWLEIPLEVALERASEVARCARRRGGHAYVGSTSDPAWRFRGGWYLTSGRAVDGWAFMPGHHEQWQRMVVVGCWRDEECAAAEAAAILHVQARVPGALENRCGDARGLSIRPHGYSFVYCCYQERHYR